MPGGGNALKEIVAFFGLDFDKGSFKEVDTGIEKLRGRIITLARVFTTGIIANEFRKFVTDTARLGDNVAKTAGKLGVTTQALQELRYAGELAGIATNTMDMGLQRFIRRAAEASKGTGEAQDALRELGIRLTDSNGKLRPAEELLGDVAEGMKRAKTDGDRLRLAFKLFDSEGVAMVNVLRDGRDGLGGMREEAEALGLVMSDELIASSVEYADTMTRLNGVTQGLKNLVAEDLLPSIIESSKSMIEFVRRNRELISHHVIEGVRAIALLFRNITTVVVGAAKAIWSFASMFGDLGKVMLGVVAIGSTLVLLFGSTAITVGALILLLDDLFAFFRGEKSILGVLSEWADQWQTYFEQSPIRADDVWFVKIFKTVAKWIKTARDYWAEFFGELAFNSDSPVGKTIAKFFGVGYGKSFFQEAADWWSEGETEPTPRAREPARVPPTPRPTSRAREPARVPPTPRVRRLARETRAPVRIVQPVQEARPRRAPVFEAPAWMATQPRVAPAASVAPSTSMSSTVEVNQTINAAPGQSPKEIGDVAAKAAKEVLAAENRKVVRALVPHAVTE